MPTLFEPTTLAGVSLPNRFVRSATWEGLAAPDGSVTDALTEYMVALAEGHVGLIISGHAFVSPEGRAGPSQLAVHSDEFVPGLAGMAAAVHEAEGKIALQLAHAGLRGVAADEGYEPVGPAPYQAEEGLVGRAASAEDLAAIVAAFAAAAARAKATGYDAVQIHSAHGYLLSQFLSPYFNTRSDGYGGDVAGRARLVREVAAAVRKAVGPGYPILIKINSEDFLAGGLTQEDMLATVAILEQAGLDAVELSGGTFLSAPEFRSMRTQPSPNVPPPPYYEGAALRLKAQSRLPVILVGGVRDYDTARRLVAEDVADYVALSRPLIKEPDLVRRWESGDRAPSTCRSDNRCFVRALKGRGLDCVHRR